MINCCILCIMCIVASLCNLCWKKSLFFVFFCDTEKHPPDIQCNRSSKEGDCFLPKAVLLFVHVLGCFKPTPSYFFYVTPLLHVAVPHKLCWWNKLPCRTADLEFCKILKQKHTQVTSLVVVIIVSSMLHLRYRSAKCWHQSLRSGRFWAVSSFSFREFHIVLNSCRARFARTSHWSSVVRGRSCWSWSCLTFMRRAQTLSLIHIWRCRRRG